MSTLTWTQQTTYTKKRPEAKATAREIASQPIEPNYYYYDTGEVNSFIIIILEAGIFFKNRIIYIPTENATPIKKGRRVSDDHLMTVPHIHLTCHSPGT